MPPDEPNEEEQIEQLPEDNQTPFSPADPPRDPDAEPDDERQNEEELDPTHPATDSNMELGGVYEEGVAGEANASEPNAGNAVVDYNKPENGAGAEDSEEGEKQENG